MTTSKKNPRASFVGKFTKENKGKFYFQDATNVTYREKLLQNRRAEKLHHIRMEIAAFLDCHASTMDQEDQLALKSAWEGFGLLYQKYSGKFPT